MPKRRSRARLTPTEAKEEYLERAGKLWDDFNALYKANPVEPAGALASKSSPSPEG